MRARRILQRAGALVGALGLSVTAVGAVQMATATASHAAAGTGFGSGGGVSVTAGGPDCNGIMPTAGSANTLKTLTGGSLVSGGTADYAVTFPADPGSSGTFTVGDCALEGPAGATDLKSFTVLDEATFGFVDNGTAFQLNFTFTIPAGVAPGTQICNVAKTTSSPSHSQASNRKAGPACFTIGGAAEFQKQDLLGNPVAGGTFQISNCSNSSANPVLQPIIVDPAPTGATPPEGTVTGPSSISFNGPSGSTCKVTETTAPPGYQINSTPVTISIPASPGPTAVFVLKDTPAVFATKLTTTQSKDFQLGGAVTTISDVAHLTLSAGASTGNLSFHIYKDNSTCDPASDVTPGGWSPIAVTGSGDVNSPTPDYAPSAAGTYYFAADYTSTDGKNANFDAATQGTCADEPVVVTPAAGAITIAKDANPSDGTVFTFTPTNFNGGTAFDLSDPGTVADPVSKTFTGLGAGTYSVTEAGSPGWNQGTTTCTVTDNSGTGKATGSVGGVSITLGGPTDSATCTFHNTKQASITVNKATVPAGSAQTFPFTTTGGTSPSSFNLTGAAGGNSQDLTGLTPGAYSVTEGATAGWDATGLTCTGTAAAPVYTGFAKAALTLAPGEHAICSYTNTQEGTLKVVKDTVPTSSQNFVFDVTNAAGTPLSGSPATVPGNGGSHTFINLVTNQTYTVAETAASSWTLTNAACTGNASAATPTASGVKVPVGPGENVVCTITNTAVVVVGPVANNPTTTTTTTLACPPPGIAGPGGTCVQGESLTPDPQIIKTADAASVNDGQPIGFTITLNNPGNADTQATISDPLPTAKGLSWSIDKQPINGPTCSIGNGTLTCGPANLAVGASWSVHIISPTTADSCGTINNTASVSSPNLTAPRSASASETVTCVLGLTVSAPPAVATPVQNLPFTGANTARLLSLGATSAMIGAILMLLGRRRPEDELVPVTADDPLGRL